jgi:hypothetical protein
VHQTWKEHGSTWTEDVLFVIPETVWVVTNLTLNYAVPHTRSEQLATSGVVRLNITDRGGFVNFNHTYPGYERDAVQEDPGLWYHAYRAAWPNNAYSMAFMNVTSVANDTMGTRSLDYLNSEMDETFPLYYPNGKSASYIQTDPRSSSITAQFGDYILRTEGTSNVSTIGKKTTTYNFEAQEPLYTNPFVISSSGWAYVGKAFFITVFSR